MDDWSGAVVVGNERDAEQAHRVSTRFYYKSKEDAVESEKAGSPKFKDVEYVEMRIPGDKLNVVHDPVTDKHRRMWPQRYAAWKAGHQDVASGMPIEELPGIRASLVDELKFHKIRTVEELANLHDELLSRLGVGFRALSIKAKSYLEKAQGRDVSETLRLELAKRDTEMALMRKQIEALSLRAADEAQPTERESKRRPPKEA